MDELGLWDKEVSHHSLIRELIKKSQLNVLHKYAWKIEQKAEWKTKFSSGFIEFTSEEDDDKESESLRDAETL